MRLIVFKQIYTVLISCVVFILMGCGEHNEDVVVKSVIPAPNYYVINSGKPFIVNDQVKVVLSDNNVDIKLLSLAQQFISTLTNHFSLNLTLNDETELNSEDSVIYFRLTDESYDTAQYELSVDNNSVVISAGTYQGLFFSRNLSRSFLWYSNFLSIIKWSTK